jgi:hypothetical protein
MKRTNPVGATSDNFNVEMNNALLDLYSSTAYLTLNKKLLSKLGPTKAVFISNLIDKYKLHRDKPECENGWFYQTHAVQMETTGMAENAIRSCKGFFSKEGVLEIKKMGLPAQEYYRINIQQLHRMVRDPIKGLESMKSKGQETMKPKGLSLYIKENIKKENIYTPDLENKPSSNGKIIPSQFEEFWKLYPRRENKGAAKKAWSKLCQKKNADQPTWIEIRKALHLQKKAWSDPQYIPHPASWLNGERWQDDPPIPRKPTPTRPARLEDPYIRFKSNTAPPPHQIINVDIQ